MNTQTNATTGTLWQDLKALPGRYWILFSGTLINRFGHFVIPFLAVYLRREGYEAWVIGWSLAAFGAGALLAGVIGGYLADRIGRKATLVLSCAGAAATMIALSQAVTPFALIAATWGNGLLSAMYFPAASALLADMVPLHLRVRAFSCQRLAVNLGFAMGMATAGLVAQHSFLILFLVDAATTALLGLAILVGLPGGRRVVAEGAGWGVALRHLRTNRPFLGTVAATFCIAMVFWQMSSSYGLHVTEGGGHGEKVYGLILALNGVMIVLFELPLTSFTRRFSPPRVMAAGYVLVGVGMLINVFGASVSILLISMVIFTVGEMISLPVGHSYMASLAPEDMRGRYMGVLSIAWSSATMIGPAAGVALYQFSPPVLWVVVFMVSCLAALAVLALGARDPVEEKIPALADPVPDA